MNELKNNCILISQLDSSYDRMRSYLTKIGKSKKGLKVQMRMYEYDPVTDSIVIPRGFYKYLPDDVKDSLYDTQTLSLDFRVSENFDDYRYLLDGIELRDDQIEVVIQSLKARRGVDNLSTGAGKTIIFAAVLKYLSKELGYYPSTLIIEPSNYLVNDVVSRFKSYGIDATTYNSIRGRLGDNTCQVIVGHPKSIYNDIQNGVEWIGKVKIIIGDEFHHVGSARTWQIVINSAINVEIVLGFSASMIPVSKFPVNSLTRLTYNEAMIIGYAGPCLVNNNYSFYNEIGALASVEVIRMRHPADEKCDINDWHDIRGSVLESSSRSTLVRKIAQLLFSYQYRVLILVATRSHGEKLVSEFGRFGVGDQCLISYGGGQFMTYDNLLQKVKLDSEVSMEDFKSRRYNILIGTSHILEGFDCPDLDAVIMISPGKKPRSVIQGSGRALRVSKSHTHGKGLLIDFTDHRNNILRHHSELRRSMMTSTLGIDQSSIHDDVSLESLCTILDQLGD